VSPFARTDKVPSLLACRARWSSFVENPPSPSAPFDGETLAAKLAPQVASINVTDSSQFQLPLQQFVDLAERDGDAFHAAARANPQFKHAPASLRPLVLFIIHDSDKCTKV
jgi:hypothetical protein